MSSAESLRDWTAVIAAGIAIGSVSIIFLIARLRSIRIQKRDAATRTVYDELEDTHGEFLRGRRNFFILLFILIAFIVTVSILKWGQ
jgi:hypothetical protein